MPVRRWTALAIALLVSLVLTGCEPPKTTSGTGSSGKKTTATQKKTTTTQTGATVRITASKKTCWAGQIGAATKKGCGSATFQVKASNGSYRVNLRKTKGADGLTVVLVVNGKKVDKGRISTSSSVVAISYASS
jgi:outer membrane biogenesis lipoprotein LolB